MDEIKISSNRSFGLVFFIVFLLIALYPLLKGSDLRIWSLVISFVFLVLGLINSQIITPLNRLLFKFGLLLGRFISPLIMGIIFFVVVTPIGIMMRLLKKDLLNLKYNKKGTYWIDKSGPKSKMKNQFQNEFYKRILGVSKGKKEILAFTNYNSSCFIWWVNCFNPRFCSSSIYLYNFLK